jgi:arylsulfatase A-like enzyme
VGLRGAPDAIAAWRAMLPAGTPTCALVVADECTLPYGRANHEPPTRGAPPPSPDAEPHVLAEELLLDREAHAARVAAQPEALQVARRWMTVGWRDAPRPDLAARVRAAYDQSVAAADAMLGTLLERFAAESLVVVTSTGGTAFGEHGVLGPGRDLSDEQVRVPLVFGGGTYLVGDGGWSKAASLVDVLPTLLDVLELPALPDLTGVSLRRVLLGETARGAVVAQESELPVNTGVAEAQATQVAVRSLRWKYVVRFDKRAGTVVERAFDLDADPGERRDLAQEGVASAVPFDETFADAVERVRDGIWGSVGAHNALVTEPYGQGGRVLTDRPPRAGMR